MDSGQVVRYRRVRLRCGEQVLSAAENWYVPGRLTGEMNRVLDSSDTPFGRVVAPLEPYRRTFHARLPWSPLPEGWERAAATSPPCASSGPLAVPDDLLEHRALLYASDGQPIAEVHEVYQRGAPVSGTSPVLIARIVRRPTRAGRRPLDVSLPSRFGWMRRKLHRDEPETPGGGRAPKTRGWNRSCKLRPFLRFWRLPHGGRGPHPPGQTRT